MNIIPVTFALFPKKLIHLRQKPASVTLSLKLVPEIENCLFFVISHPHCLDIRPSNLNCLCIKMGAILHMMNFNSNQFSLFPLFLSFFMLKFSKLKIKVFNCEALFCIVLFQVNENLSKRRGLFLCFSLQDLGCFCRTWMTCMIIFFTNITKDKFLLKPWGFCQTKSITCLNQDFYPVTII